MNYSQHKAAFVGPPTWREVAIQRLRSYSPKLVDIVTAPHPFVELMRNDLAAWKITRKVIATTRGD